LFRTLISNDSAHEHVNTVQLNTMAVFTIVVCVYCAQ